MINIKLDKIGGLPEEALVLIGYAKQQSLGYMVRSNGGTLLAAAPSCLLTENARYADIDSPIMLAADIANGVRYAAGRALAPAEAHWGAW